MFRNASRRTLSIASIVLAVILFVTVNLIASLTLESARVDLTEDKLFTVTDATHNVIDNLVEPVRLRFYYSSALVEAAPEFQVYADRISELLRTYERISNGKIKVERIDPVSFSEEENRAVSYGILGLTLNRTGEQGYFGLVGTNSVDQIEVIEFLSPDREGFLEYDLTRMVSRLSKPTEPRIGVFDTANLFGNTALGRQPSAMINFLAEDYAVVNLSLTLTAIPQDLDAVVIAHPYALSDTALYAIDQYVMRGGPVLVFLDQNWQRSPAQPGSLNAQYPASDLEPLMTAWGVDLLDDQVVLDRDIALLVRATNANQVITYPNPPLLAIPQANFNPDDVVTGQLTIPMRMEGAGALVPRDGATTTFEPLIRSSANNMLVPRSVIDQRRSPLDLMSSIVPSGTPAVLAARISGPVQTAFPDGPPPVPPPDPDAPRPDPQPTLIRDSQQPVDIIVVADVDILSDALVISPTTGQTNTSNADFVLNAIDSLTGGNELVNLRGRGLSYRPFTTVNEMESKARAEFQDREAQLRSELLTTQTQLQQLQTQASATGTVTNLTQQQQQRIAELTRNSNELAQQLRDVQAALRADIDNLDTTLRLINIGLIPLIVILIGILVAIWRRVRLANYLRSRRAAQA